MPNALPVDIERLENLGMSFEDCKIPDDLVEKRVTSWNFVTGGDRRYTKDKQVERDQLSRRVDTVARILERRIQNERGKVSSMNATSLTDNQMILLKKLVEASHGDDGQVSEFLFHQSL